MNWSRTSNLFIFIAYISLQRILSSVTSLQQISFEEKSSIPLSDSSHKYLLLEISQMKYEEEGIITFVVPLELIKTKSIESINTLVIKEKANNLNSYFPIKSAESLFLFEQAFERIYNGAFENVIHLYFNKTLNNDNDVYLLIDLYTHNHPRELSNNTLIVSPVSLIQNSTFNIAYNNTGYYSSINPYNPIYISFSLNNIDGFQNIIFYCRRHMMTIYYDNLVSENKINEKRIYTNIISSQSYDYDNNKNKHKRIIIKFLSNVKEPFYYEIVNMKNPFILLKPFDNKVIFPIDIIHQNQKVFIVGINHELEKLVSSDMFLYVEHLYGYAKVFYLDKFEFGFVQTSELIDYAFTEVTSVIKLTGLNDFIFIRCDSPCRLNIVIFNHKRYTSIRNKGLYFLALNNKEKSRVIEMKNTGIYNLEVLSLNNDVVEIRYDYQIIDLNQKSNPIRMIINNKYHDHLNPILFLTTNGAYLKLIISVSDIFTFVPYGNSIYSDEILVFQFDNNHNINKWVITFNRNEQDNKKKCFHEYYGYGNKNSIVLPTFGKICFENKQSITFVNPNHQLNRLNSNSTDNSLFYYYVINKIDIDKSQYQINYNYEQILYLPSLEVNQPFLFNSNKYLFNEHKYYLVENYNPNQKLLLNFYKCSCNPFAYNLTYHGHILSQDIISKNRTMIPLDNYFTQFTIEFYEYQSMPFAFIFSYSYNKDKYLAYYVENNNYKIQYIQEGSVFIIEWNTFIFKSLNITYMIYVSEFNDNKDENKCSFIKTKPFDTVYSPANNSINKLNYTLSIKYNGKYRVNIIAKENSTLHISGVYNEIIISVKTISNLKQKLVISVSVLLLLFSIYLWKIKTQFKNNKNIIQTDKFRI